MAEFGRVGKITRVLQRLFDDGKRNFVIYPFGDWGMVTKSILNTRLGIQEKFVVDNNAKSYGGGVRDKEVGRIKGYGFARSNLSHSYG